MVTHARLLRPRFLLWLAVPLLLLWSLRGISATEVWGVLAGIGLGQIGILALVNGLVVLALSGRWWLILRAQGFSLPYLTLVGYRLAAFGVSYFTPGPLFGGEPLQVYLVQRRHQVPRPSAIAAVTLDKTLELLFNSAFLVGGLIYIIERQVLADPAGQSAILIALILLTLPVGFLLAIWANLHPISGLLQAGFRLLPEPWLRRKGWLPAYHSLHQAIQESEEQAMRFCRQHPFTMAQAFAVSLLAWASMLGEYWLALQFLGLRMTPAQSISALIAARIAFLMPLPAGLGTLEASQVLALGALGMNPTAGISLSLLIRIRDVTLGGLGLWWGELKSRLPQA
jgi:uncharacterized protein (TIRG00374 family)